MTVLEPIRIDEFCSARFVHHLCFSPNGERALLTVSTAQEDRRGYTHTLWLYTPADGSLRELTGTGSCKTACWDGETALLFPGEKDEEISALREKGEEITPVMRYDLHSGEKTELFRVPYTVLSIQPAAGGYLLSIDFDNQRPDLTGLTGEEREQALSAIEAEKDYQIIDELPYWQNGAGWTNKKRTRLALYRDGALTFLTPALSDVLEFHTEGGRGLYSAETFSTVNHHFSTIAEIDRTTGGHTRWLEDGQYDAAGIGWYKGGVLFLGTDKKAYGINENLSTYWIAPEGTVTKIVTPDLDAYNFVGSDCRMGGGTIIRIRDDRVFYIVTRGVYS